MFASQDPTSTTNPSAQTFLDIYDVTNDILIMRDGSTALLISVSAMNFALLAEPEQDAIIYSYAGLLNSLNYPVQIVVRSQTKDVTKYLALLKEEEDQSDSEVKRNWIARYREFVGDLIKERNVLDKKFYVVVPATNLEMGFLSTGTFLPGAKQSDASSVERSVILEKAKEILEPKRDHLMAQFGRIGLQSAQLTTQEIIQLFYLSYNPEAAQGQQITDTNSYTTPLVEASMQGGIMDNYTTQPTQPGATPDGAQGQNQPQAQSQGQPQAQEPQPTPTNPLGQDQGGADQAPTQPAPTQPTPTQPTPAPVTPSQPVTEQPANIQPIPNQLTPGQQPGNPPTMGQELGQNQPPTSPNPAPPVTPPATDGQAPTSTTTPTMPSGVDQPGPTNQPEQTKPATTPPMPGNPVPPIAESTPTPPAPTGDKPTSTPTSTSTSQGDESAKGQTPKPDSGLEEAQEAINSTLKELGGEGEVNSADSTTTNPAANQGDTTNMVPSDQPIKVEPTDKPSQPMMGQPVVPGPIGTPNPGHQGEVGGDGSAPKTSPDAKDAASPDKDKPAPGELPEI